MISKQNLLLKEKSEIILSLFKSFEKLNIPIGVFNFLFENKNKKISSLEFDSLRNLYILTTNN